MSSKFNLVDVERKMIFLKEKLEHLRPEVELLEVQVKLAELVWKLTKKVKAHDPVYLLSLLVLAAFSFVREKHLSIDDVCFLISPFTAEYSDQFRDRVGKIIWHFYSFNVIEYYKNHGFPSRFNLTVSGHELLESIQKGSKARPFALVEKLEPRKVVDGDVLRAIHKFSPGPTGMAIEDIFLVLVVSHPDVFPHGRYDLEGWEVINAAFSRLCKAGLLARLTRESEESYRLTQDGLLRVPMEVPVKPSLAQSGMPLHREVCRTIQNLLQIGKPTILPEIHRELASRFDPISIPNVEALRPILDFLRGEKFIEGVGQRIKDVSYETDGASIERGDETWRRYTITPNAKKLLSGP